MRPPEHILLVDKPVGISSFDVIRRLRQKTGIRKYGHGGTLDPLASGLMVIGVGEGTKLLANYVKLDKEYIAEIRLGERTTTGDLAGDIIESADVPELPEELLRDTLAGMVGTLTLPVSAYSAIKRDGVPMYKRARAAEREGRTISDVPMRNMQMHDAELLDIINDIENSTVNRTNCGAVRVRFAVGSGTYIRSLAEEFGRRLGYPATLQALRRTRVGEFRIEDAETLD